MAPTKYNKFSSILHCCMKGNAEKREEEECRRQIYIQKVQGRARNSAGEDGNKNGRRIGTHRRPSTRLERTNRPPEMTALEFEDDDEGACIGYARILKTPQKERRIKLKPIRKMSEEEEEEGEEMVALNEVDGTEQRRSESNHPQPPPISTIVEPLSATPVHQKMAAMIVHHPFKQQNGGGRQEGEERKRRKELLLLESPHNNDDDRFRIEDVTDDPRYKDYGKDEDGEFEEGALVEYCRSKVVKPSAVLKQPPLVVRRPSSAVRTPNPAAPPKAATTTALFANGRSKRESSAPMNGNLAAAAGKLGGTMPRRGPTTATTTANNSSTALGRSILPMRSNSQRSGVGGIRGAPASQAMTTKSPSKLVTGGGGTGTSNTTTTTTSSNGRWRSNSSAFGGQQQGEGRAQVAPTAEGTTQKTPMAHVIDVEVGQPCSRMAICNCYGFRPHQWRKVCVHCKCDRSEHEIGPNQASVNVYERLGIKPQGEMAKVLQQRKQSAQQKGGQQPNGNNNNNNDVVAMAMGSVGHGYAWVPPGISRIKVEEYMSQLPNHMIPRLNSIGEKNREKQLMVQLPRQDLSIAYCKHLKTPQERRLYEEFVNARNEVALDIGHVNANIQKAMECRKCRGVVERNEMAVVAPKLGESTGWHAACFACQTCEQLLVDLTYCVRDDKIFCERHFAEMHKPRCSACDELIFAGEYTKAMNKDWHSDHFCCWQCDGQLTGQRYILRDDHPYCIKCYEEIFANVCDECQKHIGIDSKDLSYKDKHWHEECFLCTMCKVSLVDKPFGSKNERIYCSNCYDNAFATRCDGCSEIFKAGMKKMEYKGKQWHDKCFVCAHCKAPIGTRSFIPKNEEVFCATCYEEKFATRCCKCKKVISTGGVTYKNEPWHRECFCCTNCSSSLAGQRFTSKDEKPYCADCYGELFAKRCSSCVKPITGIGGAKFISFEDRHWHNDCFLCSQCSMSLVGKGFITDGADILCAECAKARLMASNS